MDIMASVEALMEEIRKAKTVPFSASAMINKQEVLDRLEEIRNAAPDEIKQARWIMRDCDDVLEKVNKEAEQILAGARAERDRLVARTEIVNAANREADKIIEEAKARAREIRMEAEDYVDAKLANFEVILQKTLAAVMKGRESLRGRVEPETPEAAQEPEQVINGQREPARAPARSRRR